MERIRQDRETAFRHEDVADVTLFGITSSSRRLGAENFKGFNREQFDDAFASYLPPQTVTPSQPA